MKVTIANSSTVSAGAEKPLYVSLDNYLYMSGSVAVNNILTTYLPVESKTVSVEGDTVVANIKTKLGPGYFLTSHIVPGKSVQRNHGVAHVTLVQSTARDLSVRTDFSVVFVDSTTNEVVLEAAGPVLGQVIIEP